MFAYSVTGARKLVHANLVAGVDLQARGWPQREHLSKMTGFKGATGGPWTTDASMTIQPTMYAGKGVGADPGLHAAQEAFFTGEALLLFDPGCARSRLMFDLSCRALVCVALFVELRSGVTVTVLELS